MIQAGESYQIRLNDHTKKSQKFCGYGIATMGNWPDLISPQSARKLTQIVGLVKDKSPETNEEWDEFMRIWDDED